MTLVAAHLIRGLTPQVSSTFYISGGSARASKAQRARRHGLDAGGLSPISGKSPSSEGLNPKAAVFAELAERLSKLAPDHRDPHRFHEDKSEIVGELLRLADEVRRG